MNANVKAHRIWLEVTEGTLMKDDMSGIIENLRTMGFHFSLDDLEPEQKPRNTCCSRRY